MIRPRHDYWPMTGWAEYVCFEIDGYFHADTMALDVNARRRLPSRDIRRTYTPMPDPSFLPAVVMVESPPGTSPPPNWPDTANDALVQGVERRADGSGWIGELGNLRAWTASPRDWIDLQIPPLPELPLRLTDYLDPISGSIAMTRTNKLTGEAFHETGTWRFRNLGLKEWWWQDRYGATLRTALEENPGKPGGRYNFQLAKDVGLVDVWWINADLDGHGSGWEWQLTAYQP